MTTYILNISNKAKKQPDIERFKRLYNNGQDALLVKYVDDVLDNGFVFTKDDNLITKVVDMRKDAIDKDLKSQVMKERKIIKEGAISSKDTSMTKGAKPYEPK